MDNTLEKIREAVAEAIKPILKKSDMTPADLEILSKAVCIMETIKRWQWHYDDENFYGHGGGYSRRYYDGNIHNGYSGHSIHDRMVAQLEHMMDETQSDYERQQIREFIKKARGN